MPPKKMLINIMVIYDPATGACKVNAPLAMKAVCVCALAEALKVVATHQPSVLTPVTEMPNGASNGEGHA